MLKKLISILTFFTLVCANNPLIAQEIDFGDYYKYTLTVEEQNPGTGFEFGTVISGSGINSIGIANSKVLSVTGVKYLDVFLTISADDELLLGGNPGCIGNNTCSIDFTLEAAYANRGSDNIGQARIITIAANSGTAQFPIRYRTSGPPAPPPTPVYEGYDPSVFNETAYIYLYGSINIGNVDAGFYSGNIDITLIYD